MPSEGEGRKLVKGCIDYLVSQKKAYLIPDFVIKCAARYNYLAKKNNQRNLRIVQGQKVKYYNIRLGSTKKAETDYFGYPSGELPSWAPQCDKAIQWQKNVLDPLNRFLEVMKFPLLNSNGTVQFDLFGNA